MSKDGGVPIEHAAALNLVEACQAGQSWARERLCAQNGSRIYRWAVLLGLGSAAAEDAAQEVLVIAMRKIDRCRGDEVLASWLYQITRRVVANQRRSAWWRRIFLSPEPLEKAFENTSSDRVDQEIAIRRCLGTLSTKQSEVLVLMDIEGYTRSETAKLLGISEGTVASRLRLGRKNFRDNWTEDLSDDQPDGRLSWRTR